MTITYLTKTYSATTAKISVRVTLESAIAAGAICHVVLWEDNLSYGGRDYRFVARMYGTEALTITNANESQVITKEFTLNGGWVGSNLGASVYVGASNNSILNGKAAELLLDNAIAPSSLGRVKAVFK